MHAIRCGRLWLSDFVPSLRCVCWSSVEANAIAFTSCALALWTLARIAEIGADVSGCEVVLL